MPKSVTTIVTLTMLILSVISVAVTVRGETYAHRSYQWTYGGQTWAWAIDIPLSLNSGYSSVSESNRVNNRFNGWFLTTRDPFVQSIATAFRDAALRESYGSYDQVSLLLAWVQSLPYTSDSVTSPYDEFPRFPVETLYANGGDCEDTTYLFMTIVQIWGFGSVFINPPYHLAAGVLGSDLSGYYYEYDGRDYYYAETTGDDFSIGDIPDQWRDVPATIYPITVEGYVPSWSGTTTTNDPDSANPNQNTNPPSDPSSEFLRTLTQGPATVFIVAVIIVVGTVVWEEARKRKATLSQPSTVTPPAAMCPICGQLSYPNAEYCSICGIRLSGRPP